MEETGRGNKSYQKEATEDDDEWVQQWNKWGKNAIFRLKPDFSTVTLK